MALTYVFYADKLYGEYDAYAHSSDLPDGAFEYNLIAASWSVIANASRYRILPENVEHTVSAATRTLLLLLT